MSLFITGYSGFSGSHISNFLADAGCTIFTLNRNNKKNTKQHPNIIPLQGSLEDLERLPENTETVIHIAALSPTPGVSCDDLVRDNVRGTQNLIRLSEQHKIKKFIFFSTLSVYGEVRDTILTEESPIINPDSYGLTKLIGEQLLKEAKIETRLVLRFPAIIGAGAKRHWLSTTIEKALHNEEISFYNPSAEFNNAVHVRELSFFIDNLVKLSWEGFDVINLACNGSMTTQEIIDKIVFMTHSSSHLKERKGNKNSFMISTKKAETLYGYQPIPFEIAFETYLKEIMEKRKNENK